jgi:hypothetical protein
MRAFFAVVLGFAPFIATASASKVEYSEKELDDYCYSHAGVYKTDRENYWSCEIGSGKSTVHIDCNKTGKCVMYNNAVFTRPQSVYGNIVGRPAVISTGNVGISTGATRGLITGSPLKQVVSGAATASTTMAVSTPKQGGSKPAAAVSPNLGAAFMSSGRATLRPQ